MLVALATISIIWKYILSLGVIGILLVIAFVPIFFVPMWVRKPALYFAGLLVFGSLTYTVGLRDGERHATAKCVAQDTATEASAGKAWQGAEHSVPAAVDRVPNDPSDPADRDNAADNRKGVRPTDHLLKLKGHR